MLRPKRTQQFYNSISDKYFEFVLEEHSKNIISDKGFLDVLMEFKDLSINIIKKYEDRITDEDWEEIISTHPNLNLKWIQEFPDKKWSWKNMSYNSNLTLEWLNTYPNKPWNWDEISMSLYSMFSIPSIKHLFFDIFLLKAKEDNILILANAS